MYHFVTVFVVFTFFGIFLTAKGDVSKSRGDPITLMQERFGDAEKMCEGLDSLQIHSFIQRVTESFQDTCGRLEDANEYDYQSLFNIVLALAGREVSIPSANGSSLCVRTEWTDFLLEFKVNSTAEQALQLTEDYRMNYCHDMREVLCMGINYTFMKSVHASKKDQLLCDWIANLYFTNGTLQKNYPQYKINLTCT